MFDLARRIQRLYPSADLGPFGNVRVQDDGAGPYIALWDDALGPRPSQAQLNGVDVSVTPEEKTEALVIPKRVLAALVLCADTTGKPQWVQDAIAQAKTAIAAARS